MGGGVVEEGGRCERVNWYNYIYSMIRIDHHKYEQCVWSAFIVCIMNLAHI